MARYYIVPKPGYSEDDLLMSGISSKNAMIVRYSQFGEIIEKHPYTEENRIRWRALPHPNLQRAEGLFELEGRLLTLGPKIFTGFLADGWHPFKQIICLAVQEKAMKKQDIIEYVINTKRFLKDTKHSRWYLSEMIGYLSSQGFLTLERGYYKPGSRKMPIGHNRIAIREGYNPILYQAMVILRSKGTRSALAEYLILDLGWLETDPVTNMTAEEQVDWIINYLKREGYIREIAKNRFEVVRPLEKY